VTATTAAMEIRCAHCGLLIIERAGQPWKYTCRRCKGGQSSTGYSKPPELSKYDGWRRAG